MSDPSNYMMGWCWKLARPINALRNWGWLIEHRECITNKDSPYYQETRENSVCTETGAIEIQYDPYDEEFPYKLGCVAREDAVESEEESCWKMVEATPLMMTLERVRGSEGLDACSPAKLQKPFQDGVHTSSRFTDDDPEENQRGIPTLHHCNGGMYKKATVPFVLDDSGKFSGYETVVCDPMSPDLDYACRGVGHECMHHVHGAVQHAANRAKF